MSAVTNPATPQLAPPQPAPPRLVPPRPAWPRNGLRVVLLALVAAGAAYQFWWKPKQREAAPPIVTARTAQVTVGTLARSLRLSGQTSAGTYANITAPLQRGPDSRNPMVLLFLAKGGAMVKKGDLLVEIDPQWLRDHVDDTKETVRQADADVTKRKAEQAVEWENLQQTLRVAKANMDKATLDFKAAEVRTDIERELLKLSMDEAVARYKQQQNDLANRKASHAAEIRILEITAERHRRHLERDNLNLARYTLRAPMDGLVVLQTTFRGGEWSQLAQGDQASSGQPLMRIVDPRSMLIEASINQAASSALRIGQTVRIGIDAFPDAKLSGHVYSIGALAVGGWRQNYYIRNVPVRIAIDGFDPRVIPDMSAWGNVLIENAENARQVPLAAVHNENGQNFVYVRGAARFEKRPVMLGLHNDTHAAVTAGLNGGEDVRLP